MFEIDKKQFGAFVARLRREKGLTQKEVAQQLFVSDKAVSKWETGASIPDTALLVPLARLLGVSVTQLLMCGQVEDGQPMDADTVEDLVKTAIGYAEDRPLRAWQEKSGWMGGYVLCLLLGCAILIHSGGRGWPMDTQLCSLLLGGAFGAYFVFFARSKLPGCYDEHPIGAVSDGPLRMNLPGVTFNNRNWPHMVRVGRIWSCLSMTALPAVWSLGYVCAPQLWMGAEKPVFLALLLLGLFVPLYVVGKKYG